MELVSGMWVSVVYGVFGYWKVSVMGEGYG